MNAKTAVVVVAALACCMFQAVALATECPSGNLTGSLSSAAQPDENLKCRMLGRIFCLVAEQREAGVDANDAAIRTADVMNNLGTTGSHIKHDYKATATMAAEYLYARERVLPWTAYYNAAYTCGVDERVGDTATRAKLGPAWDQAEAACDKQFPGAGAHGGYPNDPLRDCLDQAMSKLIAQAAAPPARTATR